MDYRAMIEDLEIQISMLPIGYISKKNINGNVYYYQQWTENGKVKSILKKVNWNSLKVRLLKENS